jgi:hypothetical protein
MSDFGPTSDWQVSGDRRARQRFAFDFIEAEADHFKSFLAPAQTS